MVRFPLTVASVFCLCVMMPAQASFAETVYIGSGHTEIVQLSSGKTSYRRRARLKKHRAAQRENVEINTVSVQAAKQKTAPIIATVDEQSAQAKSTMEFLPSNSDMRGHVIPAALAVTPSNPQPADTQNKATDPRGVYEAYVAELKAGHDPEKVILNSLSKPKKADMMAALSKSEQMKKFGLTFIVKATQCAELSFIEQKISGNKAVVTYKGKDICSKKPNPYLKKTERVEMIKENGLWKIESSSSSDTDLILHKVDLTGKTSSKAAKIKASYDPQTIYSSYLYQIKKADGFRDAVEFFTTEQKKANMLKLLRQPKEVSKQTILAVAESTKCTFLKLVTEKINKNKATLKYAAKDICKQDPKLDRFETIELLKEKGFWKVNKITVSNT